MADVLVRLWQRIAKTPDAGECWRWSGTRDAKGLPRISVGKKSFQARRVLWESEHPGESLPKNRQVAATCKNTECMNPSHLYLRPWCDDEPRFWSHVRKVEGDGCWEWQSTFFANGYATFKMRGKQCHASRVAYEFTYGPIVGHIPGDAQAETVVMHKCDNPRCVRPDHLELGTDRTNIHDMLAKGRAGWQKKRRSETEFTSHGEKR